MTVRPSLILCPENYPRLALWIMYQAHKRRIPRWLLPIVWPLTAPRREVRRRGGFVEAHRNCTKAAP